MSFQTVEAAKATNSDRNDRMPIIRSQGCPSVSYTAAMDPAAPSTFPEVPERSGCARTASASQPRFVSRVARPRARDHAAERVEALGQPPIGEGTGIVEEPRPAHQEHQMVARIEDERLPAPVTAVPGDQPLLEDARHVIHGHAHRDRAVGMLHRHAVAVGVAPDERRRVGVGCVIRRASHPGAESGRNTVRASAGSKALVPSLSRSLHARPARHRFASASLSSASDATVGTGTARFARPKRTKHSTCPFVFTRRTRRNCVSNSAWLGSRSHCLVTCRSRLTAILATAILLLS